MILYQPNQAVTATTRTRAHWTKTVRLLASWMKQPFRQQFRTINQKSTSVSAKQHSRRGIQLTKLRSPMSVTKTVWRIKELNGTPSVTWRVVRHAKSYTPETKNCQLCLCEKFEIANYPGKDLLNKRTKIVAKYRHRCKHVHTGGMKLKVLNWNQKSLFF